jgi:hypothetical protein
MKTYLLKILLLIITLSAISCDKNPDTPTPAPPTPPTPPTPVVKTCIFSGITQRNSGNKSEFALSINYNASLNPTKISVFDSAANTLLFNANLTYASTDSIRIDAYQYIKLDANKRVVGLVTKEDMTDPVSSDNYRYEYKYSSDGYLITKNLYINESSTPVYATTYSYSNGLLVSCLMIAVSSGNKKVLESTLTYDASLSPKTMIYTFPDGFESFLYSTALNFGNRPNKPVTQIVTKIYDPAAGSLLDTWTTNYNGYSLNSDGYLVNGSANGDQQQGIITFYGKTTFLYQCQ